MRSLVIQGMGGTRKLTSFEDLKGVPVWSCNTGYKQIAEQHGHVSKIFLAHTQHDQPVMDKKTGQVVKWIKAYNIEEMNMLIEHGVEILNIHRIKELKQHLYPLARIDKKFKVNGFFSNTICYMLAYALDFSTKIVNGKLVLKPDAFEKISIYGVDMLTKDEYELEKGGLEFWLGYAMGLGIEIEISQGGALLKTCTGKPYGIRFFDPKDFDPWSMLTKGDKDTMWADQAQPTKKQIREMQKNLRRSLKV